MANKKQRKNRNKRVRQEQLARRKPLEGRTEKEVIENGRRNDLYEEYGEDGLPMTPARTRLKRVLGVYTVWGWLCIPIAVCWFITSCAPAQAYGLFGILGFAGQDTVNGWSPIVLLRVEAVVTLLGLLSMFVNSFTFSWMFGKASATWFGVLTLVLAVVYGGYLAWCLASFGIPDPISIINLVFLVIIWVFAYQAGQERPFLG
jgi:hypothetical protein